MSVLAYIVEPKEISTHIKAYLNFYSNTSLWQYSHGIFVLNCTAVLEESVTVINKKENF